jgi:hypothetical protein
MIESAKYSDFGPTADEMAKLHSGSEIARHVVRGRAASRNLRSRPPSFPMGPAQTPVGV